jgi:hypothetical protein
MAKEIPRVSITMPNGATAEVRQSSPAEISNNDGVYQGIMCMIKIVVPTLVASPTLTVRFYDKNGILLWQSGALAKNSGAAGYAIPVSLPICQREYFTAQPSIDPGATWLVTIDADYIPDVFVQF